ncbi:phenylacetate--CoA ligase family protein [Ktedonosporobacter rubrisoli]|uniref:Phenylacetate--CoA ligase family protein n=1 Tax=Ktedonosporobacter rubrisoli TaxID=2509675 RepID=A0A4V0YYY6_KTERU|nr:AMP-binding protein [Ktedonosporobacter rubrisoli]QBD77851.1 phenylacetate--CoA ligase family protein [Ktedonosporobacter rubrisoli]
MSQLETASRSDIVAHQLSRLQQGFSRIFPQNRFYQSKLEHTATALNSLEDFSQLPFTNKRELLADQAAHPPFGSNLTYLPEEYICQHQTSGTTGKPLKILDTRESWDWWAECWASIYRAAGVSSKDVIFIAFNFGPFIGFWAAHEGSKHLGALTVPGGGMDSLQRLHIIQETRATVLVCTPSYALRLAEVAQEHGIDLPSSTIRVTLHAGEPGASIPATRERIERGWGARTYDHAGMSEMGAYGFTCSQQQGLHVNESEFIAEIIDPHTNQAVQEGELGELVLTNLGRWGYPAIRYRTGDIVRNGGYTCGCGRSYLHLPGGVLGRADDMLIVKGTNVYPSAIADVLHRFPEVSEYRIIVTKNGALDEIALQVECPSELTGRIQEELHIAFNLRVPIESVELGILPRFELKARRVEDRRRKA